MYFKAQFGIVGLLFATVLAVLALMFVSNDRPSEIQMREALERELDRFKLPETVMCGVVPKGSSRADAIRCSSDSIASRTPFLVAFQEQGEDSDIWSALAGDSAGLVQALVLDSSPHGQPQTRAEYFVTSLDCPAPRFVETGHGAIDCGSERLTP